VPCCDLAWQSLCRTKVNVQAPVREYGTPQNQEITDAFGVPFHTDLIYSGVNDINAPYDRIGTRSVAVALPYGMYVVI
jgi:hypothetical protein